MSRKFRATERSQDATDKSWYKTEDAKITNNWPGTTIRYWWNTRKADLRVYEQGTRRFPIRIPSLEKLEHTTSDQTDQEVTMS